jgi:hypothetical protein
MKTLCRRMAPAQFPKPVMLPQSPIVSDCGGFPAARKHGAVDETALTPIRRLAHQRYEKAFIAGPLIAIARGSSAP